ncbi:MAG: IgA Peptidase M64 [Muribaculaceae bacterium]|nr:IgA Peptidase M64 [Muribaculaceae bacterium]
MKHVYHHIWAAILLAASALTANAAGFNDHFADSTLRLDYIFGGTAGNATALLDAQSRQAGWAGRHSRMAELPYHGNGHLTVIDSATSDTLYRTSFSSLFQEWLATDEARTTPRAFENVFLVPLPKAPARIELTLFDFRRDTIAHTAHIYDPSDELTGRQAPAPLPHRYLHRATALEAIDVAILAEGYRPEEMDSFYRHAQTAVDEILSYEPYRRYADRFNFVAVASPSAESGVIIPLEQRWPDTAFGSHFSTFHSDRYLTTPHVKAVHDALRGIPYEHIIILANTPQYGGGGIYNSYLLTSALTPKFKPVVVHEFGHSFGGLADEYFYTGDVMEDSYPFDIEPWEPNITTLVDFDSKWRPLLRKGTPIPTPVDKKDKYPVGVYEGGGYSWKGIYRPADECRMRNNEYPTFCPACEAALERLILFYTPDK